MHGQRGTPVFFAALAMTALTARVEASDPVERLAAALPRLFPAATLDYAVVGGEPGARLIDPTYEQRRLGFVTNDVVLAVDGRRLGDSSQFPPLATPGAGRSLEAAAPGDDAPPCLTVWHETPVRPVVLPPALIAEKTIDRFAGLPEAERTPMHLAVLLANDLTYSKDGFGVVLLPDAGSYDDLRWRHCANPMPPPSEAALREAATSLQQRLPEAISNPAEQRRAMQSALARRQDAEAAGWARNLLISGILDPRARENPHAIDDELRAYMETTQRLASERKQRLAPEPRIAIVAEVLLGQLESPGMEASTSLGAGLGLRVRPFPLRGARWSSDLDRVHLLVEYGREQHTWEGPGGIPVSKAELQAASLELVYRPGWHVRLRPSLRAGVGRFTLEASKPDSPGSERWVTSFDQTAFGWIFGGALDLLYLEQIGLRAALTGGIRMLRYEDAPLQMNGWRIGTIVSYYFGW